MSNLDYVGPDPVSDANIVAKAYADTTNANTQVTPTYVHQQTALITPNLVTSAYIQAQVGNAITQSQLTSQLGSYVPTSKLGAAGGLATADGTGRLTAAQVPSGTLTDRVIQSYSPTSANTFLKSGTSQQVVTTEVREFKVATILVPDPGYPWRPIPLGFIQGYASGTNPGVRTAGNGDYGQIAVMPPAGVSDQIYGCAICSGVHGYADLYPIVPYAIETQTPTTVPPLIGALELDVYASNSSGNSYTFTGTGFFVQILVVPSL